MKTQLDQHGTKLDQLGTKLDQLTDQVGQLGTKMDQQGTKLDQLTDQLGERERDFTAFIKPGGFLGLKQKPNKKIKKGSQRRA